MSYIAREAAKTAIMNYIAEQTVSKYATSAECKAARSGAEGAFNEIDYIPSADVVEVVRCEYCKYYTEHYKDTYGEYGRCDHPQQEYEIECYDMWVSTKPDDFCSYGKRREE